jgi:hypothetical protein
VSDSLTTIANVGSTMEAQYIKDRLADADIPAFVVGEHTHGLQFRSLSPFDAADIRIQVPTELADHALAVLEEGDGVEDSGAGLLIGPEALDGVEESDDATDPTCPHCGSDLIGKEDIPLWLFVLSVLLLGLPLFVFRRKPQCRSCGALL